MLREGVGDDVGGVTVREPTSITKRLLRSTKVAIACPCP